MPRRRRYEEDAPTSLLVHLDSGDANEPMEKLYKRHQNSYLHCKVREPMAKRRTAIKDVESRSDIDETLSGFEQQKEVRIKENKEEDGCLTRPGMRSKIAAE